MKIRIEWLSDDYDCETCGASFAEGARVFIDGALAIELVPVAHCYDGTSYDQENVLRRILEHLGHEVES